MKTFFSFFFILAVLLTPTFGFSQIKTSTINVGNGNEMDITITVNDNLGKVFFEVSGPSTKWFGVGLNTTTMSGAAYTIVSNNSGGNPVEYNMNGHVAPTLQTTQNLTGITSSTSGTTKTFEFDRLINTSNTDDYTFTTATTSLDIAWAIGSGTSLAYHSTNKGSTTMTFTDPCTTTVVLDTLENINICLGDSSAIFGIFQTEEGWYTDTLLNTIGCDSAVHTQYAIIDSSMNTSYEYIVVCGGDSIEISGQLITESISFIDTFQNIYGCDSIATTFAEYINNDISIGLMYSSLVATASSPTTKYYWLDCINEIIVDSTYSPLFTPSANGEYAVIKEFLSCRDTSECITINNVGLTENGNNLDIFISQKYDHLQLEFMDDYNEIKFSLSNIQGRQVISKRYNHPSNIKIPTYNLTKGVYFIQILVGRNLLEQKIIIR